MPVLRRSPLVEEQWSAFTLTQRATPPCSAAGCSRCSPAGTGRRRPWSPGRSHRDVQCAASAGNRRQIDRRLGAAHVVEPPGRRCPASRTRPCRATRTSSSVAGRPAADGLEVRRLVPEHRAVVPDLRLPVGAGTVVASPSSRCSRGRRLEVGVARPIDRRTPARLRTATSTNQRRSRLCGLLRGQWNRGVLGRRCAHHAADGCLSHRSLPCLWRWMQRNTHRALPYALRRPGSAIYAGPGPRRTRGRRWFHRAVARSRGANIPAAAKGSRTGI